MQQRCTHGETEGGPIPCASLNSLLFGSGQPDSRGTQLFLPRSVCGAHWTDHRTTRNMGPDLGVLEASASSRVLCSFVVEEVPQRNRHLTRPDSFLPGTEVPIKAAVPVSLHQLFQCVL